MKTNKALGATIINVVENQIRANNLPETKQTYDRLLKLGISATEAKAYRLIRSNWVVPNYVTQRTFQWKKIYKLPEEPFDD